jgi:hypothetical protein
MGRDMLNLNILKNKKPLTAVFVFFFSIFGIQSSYADPGRRLEINVNALTYANQNPTDLTINSWWGGTGLTNKVYRTFGVREGDTLIFNASNVSDIDSRDLYDIVGYFNGNSGFAINFFKNNAAVSYDSFTYNEINGYKLDENANLDSYRLEVTLGSDPVLQGFNSIGPVLGAVGFPSLSTSEYYSWELHSSGQWAGSSPAPASLRQSTNLYFSQSLYASDTLSDPDGELRKTVDQIMAKYGSLIK